MQDTFYNCLDFCRVYDRLPYFYITGGDPILHPDFWRLLGLLKEQRIPFTILGNPFHLNDEVCRKLKEYGCEKYQLSLDGMRETHDWFRKPGSFDITLEKIGCINRAGIRSVIMTTVSGTNLDEVPDIIDTVVEAGANVFAFARYCPTSGEKDVDIAPSRYRQLLADCDKKFREYEAAGCKTYFNKKDHLWTLYEYETGTFKIPKTAEEGMIYGGCNCGNCHLTILPTGYVFACRRVQNSRVGNVLEDRLADVWLCQMEQYRDYGKFEKCAKCELLAGLYAPSAGGRQSPLFAVCQDREVNERLGKIKRANSQPRMATAKNYVSKEQPSIADDPNLKNAFYDAPTVITLFGPKNFLFSPEDCAVAADSLGVGSCYIGQGWTAFADPYGQQVLKDWGIPAGYYAVMQLLLGYPREQDPHPTPKPRREERVLRV